MPHVITPERHSERILPDHVLDALRDPMNPIAMNTWPQGNSELAEYKKILGTGSLSKLMLWFFTSAYELNSVDPEEITNQTELRHDNPIVVARSKGEQVIEGLRREYSAQELEENPRVVLTADVTIEINGYVRHQLLRSLQETYGIETTKEILTNLRQGKQERRANLILADGLLEAIRLFSDRERIDVVWNIGFALNTTNQKYRSTVGVSVHTGLKSLFKHQVVGVFKREPDQILSRNARLDLVEIAREQKAVISVAPIFGETVIETLRAEIQHIYGYLLVAGSVALQPILDALVKKASDPEHSHGVVPDFTQWQV